MTTNIKIVFWVIYIVGPIFVDLFTPYSFLAYRWLPHEAPNAIGIEILEKHWHCRDLDCRDVADTWRDVNTRQIFTREDFRDHRQLEATRLAWTWFAYGLIACVALSLGNYFDNRDKKRAFRIFLIAISVNALIAGFTYNQECCALDL